jgi:hypothetical protein
VPVRAVVIQDGFWSQRRKTNLASSIPTMHDELFAHGRMDNFLRPEAKSTEPQTTGKRAYLNLAGYILT